VPVECTNEWTKSRLFRAAALTGVNWDRRELAAVRELFELTA
jgi:hypothetical protein